MLLFLSLCVPQYPVTKTVKVNDTHRGKLKFTRVINKADNISNVILKLVHVTTISISYSECVSHPACKASVPYYVVVCGSSGSIIFFLHYLINAWFSSYWTQNNVFWFSLQILCEIFLILRRIQRDAIIHILTSSRKVSVILASF